MLADLDPLLTASGSAAIDFVRYEPLLVAMVDTGVSQSWLPVLGTIKGAWLGVATSRRLRC